MEVATHLARTAQHEGQEEEEGRIGRAPPKPPLFLNGSLSLFGWPSLSAIQGSLTGSDPGLQLIHIIFPNLVEVFKT